MVLAVLLVIGGVKKNPAPSVEGERFLQVMCSGSDRNLKSETQCDTCDFGFTTVAEMLRPNWQTVGSGTVKDVNRKDCAY